MKLLSSYDEIRAVSVRVKARKLDAIRARDDFSQQLIDHLCGCLECLMTVIKQRGSLCDAGCPAFLCLLRGAESRIDTARSPLANVHATEEIIEEYCFNRLSMIEIKALEAHLTVCRECCQRIEHRKRFVALVKAALGRQVDCRPRGVTGLFGFNEDTGQTSEVSVSLIRGDAHRP